MVRLEIHPGDGGADAETFAGELAHAIATYSGSAVVAEGRVLTLSRL